MLGYLAGPATLTRCAETRHHQVEVTVIDSTGKRTFFVPRTADDQQIIAWLRSDVYDFLLNGEVLPLCGATDSE